MVANLWNTIIGARVIRTNKPWPNNVVNSDAFSFATLNAPVTAGIIKHEL